MQQTIWLYPRYYGLLILEIFSGAKARKRLWSLYWETTVLVSDLRLKYGGEKSKLKAIRKGCVLCRKIREHIIKVEGGKR